MNYVTLTITLLMSLKFFNAHEIYTSVEKTKALALLEVQIVDQLQRYMEILQTLKNAVDTYALAHRKSLTQLQNNPISAFHLMQRTTKDLDAITTLLTNSSPKKLLKYLEGLRKRRLPKIEDFNGAAMALVNLKKTYNLNVSSMAEGIVQPIPSSNQAVTVQTLETKAKLSASDCLVLAEFANQLNYQEQSLKWLKLAEERNAPDLGPTVEPEIIEKHLLETKNNLIYDDPENDSFQRLCSGERLMPHAMEKDLFCHYSRKTHPYFILQPLKVEVASQDPYIVLLHDVISDSQIEEIKKVAIPLLHPSPYTLDENNRPVISNQRTSSQIYLDAGQYHIFEILNRNIKEMTKLKTRAPEKEAQEYQVVNYGLGGQYTPHYDHFFGEEQYARESVKKYGDRLATWMFYLNDVEAGGATVFPTAGVSIWPKKGSAAFWWNLRSNGSGDPMTFHGGCPVLVGSKWVVNKWFLYYSQVQNWPCKLKNGAQFEKF